MGTKIGLFNLLVYAQSQLFAKRFFGLLLKICHSQGSEVWKILSAESGFLSIWLQCITMRITRK